MDAKLTCITEITDSIIEGKRTALVKFYTLFTDLTNNANCYNEGTEGV